MKIETTEEMMRGQKMNLSYLTQSEMIWKKDYEMKYLSYDKSDSVATFNKN